MYPSNLSAALYELGDYATCFQAICRAIDKCPDANATLLPRLYLRLAKTLSHGVRNASISGQSLKDNSTAIDRMESAKGMNVEFERALRDWRREKTDMATVADGAAKAKSRLAHLPIFKKNAYVL